MATCSQHVPMAAYVGFFQISKYFGCSGTESKNFDFWPFFLKNFTFELKLRGRVKFLANEAYTQASQMSWEQFKKKIVKIGHVVQELWAGTWGSPRAKMAIFRIFCHFSGSIAHTMLGFGHQRLYASQPDVFLSIYACKFFKPPVTPNFQALGCIFF